MANPLNIRLAARCEAAGRPENEDNFHVAEDLSVPNSGFRTDKIFPLGSKGTLLLVCDGMGGMNAGEVASDIGVKTIQGLFAPDRLSGDVTSSDDNACTYMKRAIVKADACIKEEGARDSAKQGMGSTAVMAWLLGDKVHVAWCGDSRCYRYNPATGLEQLSHDHSYVQDLVDTGQLNPDLAFDHPNKNIITRSLGDPRGAARPEARTFPLQQGDILLLCSDGLSDSLRDEEIEAAVSRAQNSMGTCLEALWNDSKQAGWHDNVTILLAQVMGETAHETARPMPVNQTPKEPMVQPKEPAQAPIQPQVNLQQSKPKSKGLWIALAAVMICLIAGGGWWLKQKQDAINTQKDVEQQQIDKYQQLCEQLRRVDFNRDKTEDVENHIQEVRKLYNKLVNMESLIPENQRQSAAIKAEINEKIKQRAGEIEDAERNEALAEKIRKLKIQD